MMNNKIGDFKQKKITKKTIAIFVPSLLVLIIVMVMVVISKNGLKRMMGNSLCNYTCDAGWTLDGNTCYQEKNNTSEIDAYLVGDVLNKYGQEKPDGEVTLQDWVFIRDAIKSKQELTSEQKVVYDLNGDGQVNDDDISSYSTSTSGKFMISNKYVCPMGNVKIHYIYKNDSTYKRDGEERIITKYQLKGKKCIVKTITKLEKNAKCESVPDSYTIEPISVPDSHMMYIVDKDSNVAEHGGRISYSGKNKLEFKYQVYNNNQAMINNNNSYYFLVRGYDTSNNTNKGGKLSYIDDCLSMDYSGKIDLRILMHPNQYRYYTIGVYNKNDCSADHLLVEKKTDVYRVGYQDLTFETRRKSISSSSESTFNSNKVKVEMDAPDESDVTQPGKYIVKYKYSINDSETPYRYVVYHWFTSPTDSRSSNLESEHHFSNCLKIVDGMTQTFDFYTQREYTTYAQIRVFKAPTSNGCDLSYQHDGDVYTPQYVIRR